MGYSQACTGTFASPETVQQQYLEILETYPLEALAIGTRPDCLPPPVMAMLNTLARHTELWIELGVQTTHDATLTRINRGHNWACSREAILKLAEAGIDCAVHRMRAGHHRQGDLAPPRSS